jgi:arylsulfatase A-like enzyme
MDEQLGRLFQKLDELNLSKETFVFFTSDNGHMMGSHGYSSKQQWHDESTRVPAIARWPGKIKPKTVIKSLVSSIDLPSTLLDLARMKPMNANGKSMIPVLTGSGSGRQEVFSEVERSDKEGGGYWQMVRTDRNKYVRFLDGEEHFYDLQADPTESCNIVRHKRSSPEFAALREMLQKWLNSTPAVPRKQKD